MHYRRRAMGKSRQSKKGTTRAELTIKFLPSKEAQSVRQKRLETAVRSLRGDGVISSGRVEPVFPGDDDDELAGLFTVDLGTVDDMSWIVSLFGKLDGVEYAHKAGERETK